MTPQQIAEAFSIGQFDKVYPSFSGAIHWNVVGESLFEGKEAVVENCRQVAAYFSSVTTHFKTENVMVDKKQVAIEGTAEFIRDGKRISFVRACDLYKFNDRNEIESITSYCIPEKK